LSLIAAFVGPQEPAYPGEGLPSLITRFACDYLACVCPCGLWLNRELQQAARRNLDISYKVWESLRALIVLRRVHTPARLLIGVFSGSLICVCPQSRLLCGQALITP
jgi:hypothetical protein